MSGKVKVELFTSHSCPYCPAAVEMLKELEGELGDIMRWEEVDAGGELGRTKAIAYGVRSVPAIVVNSKLSFVGVPQKERLASAVKELAGER